LKYTIKIQYRHLTPKILFDDFKLKTASKHLFLKQAIHFIF
jgi:hypothetical protein